MAKLNLQKMSVQDYRSLPEVDKNALYWLDDGTIYAGGKLYGGKFLLVDADPIEFETNTLYINLAQGSIKIFDGTKLVPITTSSIGKLEHSLTIGDKVFDGTSDVIIEIYDGNVDNN